MDVIDARGAALAKARLAVRARRRGIEVRLEPVDVAGAPRPRQAVAPEGAPLGVVRGVGDVPVADVDDVEESGLASRKALPDGRLKEEAERAALEKLVRHAARRLTDLKRVVVLLGDEELADRLVLEEEPALGIQEKVVLQALRDEDVPRFLLRCRCRRIGCRHVTPLPR